MTLRKATFLLICLNSLAILLAVSVATHITLDTTFNDLERDLAVRNMERAHNAMREELDKLDGLIVDWAVWDDADNFMKGRAKDFVASNLNDRTLASLHLSAIAFLDLQGRPVWLQGFDPDQGVKAPVPEGLLERLGTDSPLLTAANMEERVKGFLLLPQGVMIVSSCPVTNSEGEGPASGTLIMLRAFGDREAAAISKRVCLPLTLERADSPMSADILSLAQRGTFDMAVGPISSTMYGGVTVLRDIWGGPALRLVLRDTREITSRGNTALNRAHLWLVAGGVLFLAALLFFLERRMLRRLGRLKAQVEAIGTDVSGSDSAKLGRVVMPGNDELSALALRINGALAELERSRMNLSTQCAMTQEQESYLQHILDSIQAGVLLVDPETHIIREANAFAAARIGRPREDMVGKLCHGFICPNPTDNCTSTDANGEQHVRTLLRADGSLLPVLKSVSRIERNGKPLLLETFIDVEELHKAQEALKRSEESYRTVFMNTGLATLLIDADTTIILANQEFEKLSGHPGKEVEGRRSWTEFFAPKDVERMLNYHVKRRQSPDLAPRNYETHFINRRGEERLVLLTVAMISNTTVSVVSIEDITERKKAEEQLRHQAFHDALTGLPNRLLLLDRLERSVESARREGEQIAVLLMDLDRFKDINDSLGHSVGDRLLKQVAARLEGAVRRSDTVARLGGDEFVLVVDGPVGQQAAGLVAQHVLDCFAQPFELEGQSLHVRLSIGIALFPGHGETPEELLKNTDLAMYRAKERGRNTYDFFTKELTDQVVMRLAVEAGLRRALASGDIEVFYQPKVEQPGNRITGAEALVRWRREDGALVSPADFIPVAENTGLIMPLSDLVLREACHQAMRWRARLHPDFVLAVNLSPRQFQQPGLAERIREIIQETGIPPKALEFEITENLLMDNRPETLDTLNALRDMGGAIVLDDFGKEYSSLSYIKKLPIQAIKIDRSFIDDLPDDQDDATIVESVLTMAANLELRVVAEGVETPEQLNFLLARGCREFQGYFFSKPLNRIDMAALLAQPEPFAAAE